MARRLVNVRNAFIRREMMRTSLTKLGWTIVQRYESRDTLSSRWRDNVYQVRPIHRDSFTQREATAIKTKSRIGMNVKFKNTRLSAAVSSTCWLPLTPKSSLKCFLNRGKLSRPCVFQQGGRYGSASGLHKKGV